MSSKKRLSGNTRFIRGISIYFVVCLALIFAVLAVLWNYLSVYESSRPEAPVEEYLSHTTVDDWLDSICGRDSLNLTDFESMEDLRRLARDRYFSDTPITYSLAAGSGDETKKYDIYSGNTRIATLTSARAGSAGYGLNRWELSTVIIHVGISPNDSRTLTIIAPFGSDVTVNGRPVPDSLITRRGIRYEDLSEYEQREDYEAPFRVEYTIDGLYMDPDVTVSEAKLVSHTDLNYEYAHASKGSYTLDMTVPSTATVTVSGLRLRSRDFTEGPADVGFDELTRYIEDIPRTLSLHWEGLAFEPQVTVRDAMGNLLEPDSEGVYALPESSSLRSDAGNMVNRFARLYLNFCTNMNGGPDAAYESMTQYLIWGSALQQRLNNARDGYIWVTGVSNDIHDLSASNYRRYSETLGCCDLHIKVSTHTYYEVRETDTTVHLVLMKRDGVWKVASMTTVE